MSSSDGRSNRGSSPLSQELIEAGAAIIEALDAAAAGPDVAFWLWFRDVAGWRLMLADGRLLRHGDRIARDRIHRMLRESEEFAPLTAELVGVARGDARAVSVLRSAIQTGPGIHGMRIRDNVLNGVRVQAAHVYRVV